MDILITVISCIIIIGMFIGGVVNAAVHEEFTGNYIWFVKKIFWIPLLALLISCFIPSQKTMYLMLGANFIKNSTLPSKVELAIEKRIDQYLADDDKKENKA
jgi:MFS family permease